MDLRTLVEKCSNLLGLVLQEVVGNDMNLLASGLMGHDVGQEGNKLGGGMTGGGFAEDFTGSVIKGGLQRERTVPDVFKSMALSATRRDRQHGVVAFERLNCCLLVEPEHGRTLRRIDYNLITSAALVSKSGALEAT